jgi:hypothetical protein
MTSFTPCLDTLPAPQRSLWDQLHDTPAGFTLYGGTAIALRLGHRISVDLDFFSAQAFTPNALMARVPYLQGGTLRHSAPNTLTCTLDRGGPVQVSFFGGLSLGQVAPTEEAAGPGIQVASLIDLAGTKIAVITQRAELKDYLDIHALLTQAKIPLPNMLAAAVIIYGGQFSPLLALKALAYHGDAALADLSADTRHDLVAAIPGVDPEHLPALETVRRHGERR